MSVTVFRHNLGNTGRPPGPLIGGLLVERALHINPKQNEIQVETPCVPIVCIYTALL